MELLFVILMIVVGAGLATAVAAAARLRDQAASGGSETPTREIVAASILFELARLGGASREQAMKLVREEAHNPAPIREGIDLHSWSAGFASASTPPSRERLLEHAVKIAVILNSTIPLGQYNALVDVSFGLGFQSDALARLRARYRFDYVDYAKAGRPHSADRSGSGAPLFARSAADHATSLALLGLDSSSKRTDVVSAYRKMASRYHPDRFHEATSDAKQEASARFIEITVAYERLLNSPDLE